MSAIAVAVLCAAGAQLGAPLWLWAIAAGVAVGLLAYAVLVRRDETPEGSPGPESGGNLNQGPGAGSEYKDSKVYNISVGGKRKG